MIQQNAGLFCPVLLFQALCAWISVIDGKCGVLFIKSHIFFKAYSLKAADLLCMFKEELNF